MTTQRAEAADESADDDARVEPAPPDGTPSDGTPSDGALPDGEVLRAVFADLGAGLYLTDRAGRISAVNPRAETLLERPAEALVGADAHDLLHRDEHGAPLPRSACELLAVLEHGRTARGDGRCGTFLRGSGRLLPIAWTASPIRRNGRLCGAAVLFVDADERRAAAQRQADHLAALEHVTGRLAAVTEIGAVLGQVSGVDEALARVGRLLVPRLADWAAVELRTGPAEVCRVLVVPPGGDPVSRAAEESRADISGGRGQEIWQGPLPPLTDSSRAPLARVLRGSEALLLGPDDIAAAADSPLAAAHGELFSAFGAASAIVAPLGAARQVLGALTVARLDPAHPFDAADLTLITDIARRAALAVDNADLCTRQRDAALTMQRHLLDPLPALEPLRLAARYRPAPRGSLIGGDWYDAMMLPDGVVAAMVGDVPGHDMTTAADMARLRHMLRSLCWDRQEPPSLIVDRLDDAVVHITGIDAVTVVLARVEGSGAGPWQLHWVSAGHLPPLLVTDDGHSRYLTSGQNLLLGLGLARDESRYDAIEPLPAASTVLLYTDGLVKAPDGDLDAGMDRLRRHAAALARRPVGDFCDRLLERMACGANDDTALLAVRIPGAGEEDGDTTPGRSGASTRFAEGRA
ncbi:SpoIIE family protein phosphatase [Planobispora rosea]|uniref:SpoIIE family protein phosphatase n=1 Tax=Planobispora rosea TaxID=35762 RepID=UPI0009FCDB8F|nr:SpoIIE family protein phosphatase [Planobispora rosea]